jgi:hypothetical protein
MEPSLVGKPLTAIILAPDTNVADHEWRPSVIVVDEHSNNDFAERVGICVGAPEGDDFTELTENCKWGTAPFLHLNDIRDFQNKQDIKGWIARRSIRTIRLG